MITNNIGNFMVPKLKQIAPSKLQENNEIYISRQLSVHTNLENLSTKSKTYIFGLLFRSANTGQHKQIASRISQIFLN